MPAAQRRFEIRPTREFPKGGFTPPLGFKSARGPAQSKLCAGAQVRVPISGLKAWLEEKLAY